MSYLFESSVRDLSLPRATANRTRHMWSSVMFAALVAFPAAVMAQQRPAVAKPMRPAPDRMNADSNRKLPAVSMDFDGDRKSDFVLFRPSEGKWYIRQSTGGDTIVEFGVASDRLVPRDYDGDGKTDIAVYRPSEGKWYVRPSNGGQDIVVMWGESSDRLVPGDYDGDGKTDFAIFRPAEGKWHIRYASGTTAAIEYGVASDQLVPADYDGDGKSDPAVVRGGIWHIRASSQSINPITFTPSQFRFHGRLVPADYDGDGKADLALFGGDRNLPGVGIGWCIRPSKGGPEITTDFGELSDVMVPGDYDGDGRTDLAVFRPAEGRWYVKASSGVDVPPVQFGRSSDIILGVGQESVSTRYNEVQQISSHNSYDKDRIKPDLYEQAEAGVRSFEFDIHNGGAGLGDSPHSDWDVYHIGGGRGDYCGHLSEGLGKLKRWHDDHPNHEVITVWLQLCSGWSSGGHKPVDLDNNRLAKDLPNLIYQPQQLLEQTRTTNLKDAVRKNGNSWPTLESLRGKFIIVLTGDDKECANYLADVNGYKGDASVGNNGYHGDKLCFVAPELQTRAKVDAGANESWMNAIFYNINIDEVTDAQYVWEHGYVSRVFGEGGAGGIAGAGSIENEGDWRKAIDNHAHHVATDHVTQELFSPRLKDNDGNLFRVIAR